jgi:hypothetical protein
MKLRKRFGTFRGNYTRWSSRRRDSDCESHWKKMIGNPCARKSHARFDEGELEIGLLVTTPALYSTLLKVSSG